MSKTCRWTTLAPRPLHVLHRLPPAACLATAYSLARRLGGSGLNCLVQFCKDAPTGQPPPPGGQSQTCFARPFRGRNCTSASSSTLRTVLWEIPVLATKSEIESPARYLFTMPGAAAVTVSLRKGGTSIAAFARIRATARLDRPRRAPSSGNDAPSL